MGLKIDRKALKDAFKKGKTPKQEDFENLIDSTPNIKEEGAVVFGQEGFAIFTKDESKTEGDVLEIWQHNPGEAKQICWRFNLNTDGSLSVADKEKNKLLTLSKEKEISVNGNLKIDGNIIFNNTDDSYGKKQNHVIEYCKKLKLKKDDKETIYSFSSNPDKVQVFQIRVISTQLILYYMAFYSPARDKDQKVILYDLIKSSKIFLSADDNNIYLHNILEGELSFIVQMNNIDCIF